MADIFQFILLGIVQGFTEWLPVSSKGNVAMLGTFMGIEPKVAFDYAILLHIGTLIAAIIYFRKEIAELLALENTRLMKFIFVTFAFTAVVAFPVYFMVKQVLQVQMFSLSGIMIYSSTIFTIMIGFFLIVAGILQYKKRAPKEPRLSKEVAIAVGMAQGFTVLPGLSRSGTTTSVMLFEGFSPKQAFHLSFLISIPAILFSELYFGLMEAPAWDDGLFFGIAAAAIIGFFSIGTLLKIAERVNFGKFCLGLGALYLIIAAVSVAAPLVVT